MSWSIYFYLEFTIFLQKHKYELTCNFFLEFVKYLLIFIFPFPLFLSFEFIKRSCYITENFNKLLIEICKPQEAFYFFYLGRYQNYKEWTSFILFYFYLLFIIYYLLFYFELRLESNMISQVIVTNYHTVTLSLLHYHILT